MSPWTALTLFAVSFLPWTVARPQTVSPRASTPTPRALVDQYCVVCHNQKSATAGVVLNGIDFDHVAGNAPLLERVLRKFRSGEMPPAGMPRPAAPVAAAFTKSLEESLDQAAAGNPNPGRPAVHRLNRVEYSNAIRDVLALDIQPGSALPVDDSGYGFDNIGDVLSMSPALLEKYMSAARLVSRLAVGNTTIKPSVEDLSGRRDGPGGGGPQRNERASDDLPFDSRGGFVLRYYFPVDAEYVIRVKVGQGGGDRKLEIRQPVAAGLRSIGVTFLRESAKAEVALPGGRGAAAAAAAGAPGAGRGSLPMAQLDLRLDGVKVKRFEVPEGNNPPQATGVTISGPYNITGPGDTPSRARIFVCRPAGEKDEEPCARKILAGVARRAFRRPVTDADLKPLMAFYRGGREQRDFDFGIEKALRALLVSPDFLFRVEQDPQAARPAACIGSAIWNWRRGCPSSCGVPFPTTSCWTWPRRAS